jgi:hypothetical protein
MAPRQRGLSSRPEDSYESTDSLVDKRSNKLVSETKAPPPTLNQTEADVARDKHDYFNLIALVRNLSSE